jgi:hypothetical protein
VKFFEMTFTCDECPSGEDGKLRVCHITGFWVDKEAGRFLLEYKCEACGHKEEFATSSMEMKAEFEEETASPKRIQQLFVM